MASIDKQGILIYDQITESVVIQANYLASKQDDSRVDDAINLWTGLMPCNHGTPPCSHTEIGFWVEDELWFFSSTSRKELGNGSLKKNGTRWIRANELLRNPDRWLLQEKSTFTLSTSHAIVFKIGRANILLDNTYDFYGVFADFINPVRLFLGRELTNDEIKVLKKIYCSKAVHLVDTGWLKVMSPKHRYLVALALGYKDIDNTELYLMRKGVIK